MFIVYGILFKGFLEVFHIFCSDHKKVHPYAIFKTFEVSCIENMGVVLTYNFSTLPFYKRRQHKQYFTHLRGKLFKSDLSNKYLVCHLLAIWNDFLESYKNFSIRTILFLSFYLNHWFQNTSMGTRTCWVCKVKI